MTIQQFLFDPLKDEVKKVQQKCLIYEDFTGSAPACPDLTGSVLNKIKDCEADVAAAALGEKLALKLIGFAQAVDLEHPSLNDLFKGQLVFGEFSKDCCSLLGLAAFAKDNEPHVFSRIKKILSKSATYRTIEKSIDAPSNNQLHVRFVESRKDRDRIRGTKRMQTINVGIIEKKGHDIWSSHNSTFSNYSRNTDVWKEEIEEARVELIRFQKLGCTDLAKGIEVDIKNFESQIRETYFGFNRIPMTHAAVILAKVHGYDIKHTSYRSTYKILIPRAHFKDVNFAVDNIRSDKDQSWYDYEPRSYTISELKENHCMSDDMQKFINHLEKFPEVGGRPIFDHFRILVPGIQYPDDDWRRGAYINEQGRKITGTCEKIKAAVDMMLIKKGVYCPTLLGEKDEHCYFLSYWI